MPNLPPAFDLLVAILVGLAVGTEREWSGHTVGPDGRFAGIRTFALLGAMGGFAGWFVRDGYPIAGVGVLAAGLIFPIVAYASAMRRPGTSNDSTTEVAAMVVVAIGFSSGIGYRAVASAAAAIVVLLLAEKSALQRMLQKVDALEMRAALQFAVLALVVLPLLPDDAYGPYDAFRPRSLWIVVLIFSALNFVGYVARRVIGETRGLVVTGLLGGLISSTAVTLNFSRRSRLDPDLAPSLALGVIAACTMLLPRIALVTFALRPAVSVATLPILIPPFIVGALIVARALWRHTTATAPPPAPTGNAPTGDAPNGDAPNGDAHRSKERSQNPLGLASSLQMALAFQLVLFVIAFMQDRIGNPGVLASATVLGLTDMDALTVSMTRIGADVSLTRLAAQAIGVGVLSNTLLKIGLALTLGDRAYRTRTATGLGALGVASAVGLWFAWA